MSTVFNFINLVKIFAEFFINDHSYFNFMSTSWWEITILCHPNLEDSICWRLDQFGCLGTSREVRGKFYTIQTYIPKLKYQSLEISTLFFWFHQDALNLCLPKPLASWKLINNEDWNNRWKKYWQPTEIGQHFLVYPAWLTISKNTKKIVLRLDPGTVFGTGTHPTTQLSLNFLEMCLVNQLKNISILDIGTGSGILAIAAALLGANKVHAIDVDYLAVDVALNNQCLNKINPNVLTIYQQSIDQLSESMPNKFDGIICNILAETMIHKFPKLSKLAKPNTWMILSGILLDQSENVINILEKYGWTVTNYSQKEQWCAYRICKVKKI